MELTSGRRNAVFINLIITCVVLAVVSSSMSTALQPLMAEFGIDAATAGWVTGGYTLALAVSMPLTAYLVTRFATRPLYIFAVTLYLATLVGCACAPTFAALMVARVVGACANALIASMTQVSILTIFPKEHRGSAMGWFGLSQGAAVVAGPVVGGFMIDGLGWRSLFWCMAVLCLASLVWSAASLRVSLETHARAFDVPSFALGVLAFGGITLGLGNIASAGAASAVVIAPLVIGIPAAVAFARRQARLSQPFLKIRLLKSRVFALAVVMSMALYAIVMGSSAVLPLYVQGCAGQGAFDSGLVIMPGALVMAAVGPLAGRVFDKRGIAPLAAIAGACLVVANTGMLFVDSQTPLWVAAMLNMVRCFAVGCIQTPLVTWGNNAIQNADLPHASALLTSLRNVAGALGVSVFVGVMSVAEGLPGVHLAYAGMAAVSVLILVLGTLGRRLSR